jgi:hypothetical protein
VTATRYDVDVVVTEHGAAWLRDRTDEERADLDRDGGDPPAGPASRSHPMLGFAAAWRHGGSMPRFSSSST